MGLKTLDEKIKNRKSKKGLTLIMVFLMVVCFMSWWWFEPEHPTSSISKKTTSKPTSQKITPKVSVRKTTPKPIPKKTTPPYGTVKRLRYEVKRVLGSSNRGVARMYKIEESGKSIKIGFTIDDNLTNGMIKTGAKIDVMKILKAVQSSKYDYSEVVIIGTFPLMDKYGNSEESTVLKVSYTLATVNKINWENFLYDNVYDITDSVWLHSTFR